MYQPLRGNQGGQFAYAATLFLAHIQRRFDKVLDGNALNVAGFNGLGDVGVFHDDFSCEKG
jgi:hypothetical protein